MVYKIAPWMHDMKRQMGAAYAEAEALCKPILAASSCRPGCAHCCYMISCISFPEALTIVLYLLKDQGKKSLSRLSLTCRRYMEQLQALGGRPHAEWTALHLPCPLLSANLCSVHPVRPITCRTYFVQSPPEWCDTRVEHEVEILDLVSGLQMPLHLFASELSVSIGFPPVAMAPIPVMLFFAVQLLELGQQTFKRQQEMAIGPGSLQWWCEKRSQYIVSREGNRLSFTWEV